MGQQSALPSAQDASCGRPTDPAGGELRLNLPRAHSQWSEADRKDISAFAPMIFVDGLKTRPFVGGATPSRHPRIHAQGRDLSLRLGVPVGSVAVQVAHGHGRRALVDAAPHGLSSLAHSAGRRADRDDRGCPFAPPSSSAGTAEAASSLIA